MSENYLAYATSAPGGELKRVEVSPGPLGSEEVEVAVEYCGICHSDISMIDNAWSLSGYPLVPGHEAVGRIVRAGEQVRGLEIGQRVGVGWFSASCLRCPHCLSGRHNLCAQAEQTIVGRHGGFADRVRCHWVWATPLPEKLDPRAAGPLFCGGITVFAPILDCGVLPTQRVGVIGIGGLGHLAIQFLAKWGCEVTAFTSNDSKHEEVRKLGARQVVNSADPAQLEAIAGTLDFILCTVNASLPWDAILGSLAPGGRLHLVGAVLEPIPVSAFALIGARKSVSGSPLGNPSQVATMLDFCGRHGIAPVVESFPLSRVNEALAHVRAGKARYRVVLENDTAG